MEAVRRGCRREARVDDPRLHDRQAVGHIDLEDAVQPGEHEEHRVVVGKRPAREAGAGSPRDERHLEVGEQANHGDHLVPRARQHRQAGEGAVRGEAVHRVGQPLRVRRPHVALTDDPC